MSVTRTFNPAVAAETPATMLRSSLALLKWTESINRPVVKLSSEPKIKALFLSSTEVMHLRLKTARTEQNKKWKII
jgi:hypothetical protein